VSKIALSPDSSGTATFTIASPNSNTNRTLTLPDVAGTLLTTTGDGSGLTGITSYADSDALSLFNASGSAPVFACRAWVHFDGSGTVSIDGDGNVDSITDLGTGQYRVNFTTAMQDGNYCVCTSNNASGSGGVPYHGITNGSTATTSVSIRTTNSTSFVDSSQVMVAVFR